MKNKSYFSVFLNLAAKHAGIMFFFLPVSVIFIMLFIGDGPNENEFKMTSYNYFFESEVAVEDSEALQLLADFLAAENYNLIDVEDSHMSPDELLFSSLADLKITVLPEFQKRIAFDQEAFIVETSSSRFVPETVSFSLSHFSRIMKAHIMRDFADEKTGSFFTSPAIAEKGIKEKLQQEFKTEYADKDYRLSEESLKKMRAELLYQPETHLLARPGSKTNIESKSSADIRFYQFLGYSLLYLIMSIYGLVLLDLEHPGVKLRCQIAPVSLISRNLQIFAAQIILSIVIALLTSLTGFLIIGRSMLESFNIAVLAILAAAFTFTGLTDLIINFGKKREFITTISSVLSLSLAFISGIFIYSELLPATVQKAARFFPLIYYSEYFNYIYSEPSKAYGNLLILFLFGIAYYAIALVLAKYKAEPANVVESSDESLL